jgi:CheY-like chemotaxis protein
MKPDQQTGAILLVDDDAAVRGVVKAFLESAGYTVVTAADGADGLTVFKRHQPAIALILTDVAMPNMNGVDFADRVLELNGKLPILFMSGSAHRADRGFGCMEKPFSCADLLDRLRVVYSLLKASNVRFRTSEQTPMEGTPALRN